MGGGELLAAEGADDGAVVVDEGGSEVAKDHEAEVQRCSVGDLKRRGSESKEHKEGKLARCKTETTSDKGDSAGGKTRTSGRGHEHRTARGRRG